ncbi:MAG: hypothetical protein N2Z80_07480 [Hydrogenothermaceae bacterium]|nr:hypothetical protein [Hydrogenothermaceae bacterium]
MGYGKGMILFFFFIGLGISCDNKNSLDSKVQNQEKVEFTESLESLQNLETTLLKKNKVKVYIKSTLQEVNRPKVVLFNFDDLKYVFRLNNLFLKVEDEKTSIELNAGFGLTDKDYNLFKIYMIDSLKINDKIYTKEDLKNKKLLIFFEENGKVVYHVETK